MRRARTPSPFPSRRTASVLIAGALTAGACGVFGPDDVRTVEVAAHKAVCVGISFRFCLQMRDVGTEEWMFAYDTPEGFEFEWGVRQRIVIEEETIANPAADGSSIRRSLVRVEDRRTVPADSIFTLVVPGGTTSEPAAGTHRFHFAPEAFVCSGRGDCRDLATALAGNDAVEVTLVLGETANAPFRLVDWRACGRLWPECTP
ncbi:MAG: DUF4377 domain-containing protein [Gemmatimonadetes bacterium]|nr:DUF4377 domain-containing protein [Gemmatimonadota bacterium]